MTAAFAEKYRCTKGGHDHCDRPINDPSRRRDRRHPAFRAVVFVIHSISLIRLHWVSSSLRVVYHSMGCFRALTSRSFSTRVGERRDQRMFSAMNLDLASRYSLILLPWYRAFRSSYAACKSRSESSLLTHCENVSNSVPATTS